MLLRHCWIWMKKRWIRDSLVLFESFFVRQFNISYLGMSDVKFDRHGHQIVENGSTNPEHLFTPDGIQQLTEKLNLLAT